MKLISPKDSIVSLLPPPWPPRRGAAAESFAQSYDVVMVCYRRVVRPSCPPSFFNLLLLATSLLFFPLPLALVDPHPPYLSSVPPPLLSGQCWGESCWRRPAEETSLPADNLLREISRKEISEWERVRDEGRRDGWMERNLAKFLVPDLLCQALPILQANFPSMVKHSTAPTIAWLWSRKGGG